MLSYAVYSGHHAAESNTPVGAIQVAGDLYFPYVYHEDSKGKPIFMGHLLMVRMAPSSDSDPVVPIICETCIDTAERWAGRVFLRKGNGEFFEWLGEMSSNHMINTYEIIGHSHDGVDRSSSGIPLPKTHTETMH